MRWLEMKTAISAETDSKDCQIDQRFGRCKFFAIVSTEAPDRIEFIENQGAVQGHGAGIKAAQQLLEQGVEVVITGSLGPNATQVLNQLGIKVYTAAGPLKKAVEDHLQGRLKPISEVAAAHSGLALNPGKDRVFFPLLEDNGLDSKISPHFGHAPFFGIYELKEDKLSIIANELNHSDALKSPIDQIEEVVNPSIIFAQSIGGRAISLIAQKGISLKTGPFNTVREVIEHWDELEDQKESCGH
jgi:predicted Fe-Mo cluster-binding NifX family protein